MNNSKSVWLAAVAAAIIVSGVYLWKPYPASAPAEESASATPANPNLPVVVIVMDENGFTPNEVTVKAGQKVEWINKSGRNFWPATNIHPTHSIYPDSSIFKCLTPEEPNIFDACRPIAPGQTYKFTFYRAGEWVYHDHLQAKKHGVIVVED